MSWDLINAVTPWCEVQIAKIKIELAICWPKDCIDRIFTVVT